MATMPPMSRIISVSDLPWEERQPGVKRKLLCEDPATQRRALMNRIESSAQFPRHRHVGDALVFVIEGALSDECGTITAGTMGYRPQGGCLENFSRGGRGHRFKVYPIAESLNPLGQSIHGIMPPPFVEVARSQLVIWFLACEHVKDTDHDRVGNRHDCTLLSPPRRQPPIQ